MKPKPFLTSNHLTVPCNLSAEVDKKAMRAIDMVILADTEAALTMRREEAATENILVVILRDGMSV